MTPDFGSKLESLQEENIQEVVGLTSIPYIPNIIYSRNTASTPAVNGRGGFNTQIRANASVEGRGYGAGYETPYVHIKISHDPIGGRSDGDFVIYVNFVFTDPASAGVNVNDFISTLLRDGFKHAKQSGSNVVGAVFLRFRARDNGKFTVTGLHRTLFQGGIMRGIEGGMVNSFSMSGEVIKEAIKKEINMVRFLLGTTNNNSMLNMNRMITAPYGVASSNASFIPENKLVRSGQGIRQCPKVKFIPTKLKDQITRQTIKQNPDILKK